MASLGGGVKFLDEIITRARPVERKAGKTAENWKRTTNCRGQIIQNSDST
jgi:hypothetical protein